MKAYKDLCKYLRMIEKKDVFRHEIEGNFIITNHAIQRYKERIANVNTQRAKKDIMLHLKRSKWLGDIADCKYRYYKHFVYVFKNISENNQSPRYSLLTITTIDDEEGNTYFDFFMDKRRKVLNAYFKRIKYELNIGYKKARKLVNTINEEK